MNRNVRALYFPVGDPAPEKRARNRAEARRPQDHRALPIGQLPFFGNEREDVPDQKQVEEIKQIGEIRSGDQFPLIRRQPFLLLQLFEHERWRPPAQ